jgi:hypothetical protein
MFKGSKTKPTGIVTENSSQMNLGSNMKLPGFTGLKADGLSNAISSARVGWYSRRAYFGLAGQKLQSKRHDAKDPNRQDVGV